MYLFNPKKAQLIRKNRNTFEARLINDVDFRKEIIQELNQ